MQAGADPLLTSMDTECGPRFILLKYHKCKTKKKGLKFKKQNKNNNIHQTGGECGWY